MLCGESRQFIEIEIGNEKSARTVKRQLWARNTTKKFELRPQGRYMR
jgi:hypothetical protein